MKRKFKSDSCIRLGMSRFTVLKGYIVILSQEDKDNILVEFPNIGIDWFYKPYIFAITEEL